MPASICQICGCEIPPEPPPFCCPACATPHHRDCWDYCGGCSTYGCVQRPEAGQAGTPPRPARDTGRNRPVPPPPRPALPARQPNSSGWPVMALLTLVLAIALSRSGSEKHQPRSLSDAEVLDALSSVRPGENRAALEALRNRGQKPAGSFERVRAVYCSQAPPEIRALALRTLESYRDRHAQTAGDLRKGLADADSPVVAAALELLERREPAVVGTMLAELSPLLSGPAPVANRAVRLTMTTAFPAATPVELDALSKAGAISARAARIRIAGVLVHLQPARIDAQSAILLEGLRNPNLDVSEVALLVASLLTVPLRGGTAALLERSSSLGGSADFLQAVAVLARFEAESDPDGLEMARMEVHSALTSSSSGTRLRAIRAAGRFGPHAGSLVDDLVELLGKPADRRPAMHALGLIGAAAERALSAIHVAAAKDPHFLTGSYASEAEGRIRDDLARKNRRRR